MGKRGRPGRPLHCQGLSAVRGSASLGMTATMAATRATSHGLHRIRVERAGTGAGSGANVHGDGSIVGTVETPTVGSEGTATNTCTEERGQAGTDMTSAAGLNRATPSNGIYDSLRSRSEPTKGVAVFTTSATRRSNGNLADLADRARRFLRASRTPPPCSQLHSFAWFLRWHALAWPTLWGCFRLCLLSLAVEGMRSSRNGWPHVGFCIGRTYVQTEKSLQRKLNSLYISRIRHGAEKP